MILAAVCLVLPSAAQTPREVTLRECLELCERNDPYLKNAGLDVLASRSLKAEAAWEYFPNVTVSAVGYHAMSPLLHFTLSDFLGSSDAANELKERVNAYAYENGMKPYFETMPWGYAFSATAVQPVFAGGRIVNGNRLAALGVEAAQLRRAIQRKASRDTVESKYWRIVALQEKMNTLEGAARLLDTLHKDVSSAIVAGLATDNDLMQVTVKQKELTSGKIRLRNGVRLSKMDLFNSIGLPYTYLGIDDFQIMDALDSLPAPSRIVVPDDSVAAFEESRLLEMQVEAKRLQKKMAVGEYLPQAGIGVSYGYGNPMGTKVSKANGLMFTTVQIPLTDIGKAAERARRYEYEVQKAVNEQAYLDAQLTLLLYKLRLDMEEAWEQMAVARQTVALAEDTLAKERVNYGAGYATLSEVLQCELACQNAYESLVNSRIAYHNAVRAYLHRCGR